MTIFVRLWSHWCATLTRSQAIAPDLETPYSRFSNLDHSAINGKDLDISTSSPNASSSCMRCCTRS
ncbi:hypothetical protein BDR03DRAFT_947676 [Suillus americanus]|nr:hypothetical protein BDR03DRAFT_947676 [Suillus americanus]